MSESKNKFFVNAETPLCALASMLVYLDDAGLIPLDMREAIRSHADNSISTLPMTMTATARTLSSAVQGPDAIGAQDVSNISSAMASMAEQMQGFASLAEQFQLKKVEVKTIKTA